ncbi:hypothetical protein N6B72_04865 [Chryseobacterium soli]|uniref:hypothetical protein n=1 Tax=Chryseobacterium soli TaxID=445961 RepID=UPI00295577DB|nr:hypothetical protein [Chryseobacterium soli]MDV7696249.1 hypothetical protein [Chryseobacterium soli]
MKTKLIILAAAASILLFSCSDRDQDETGKLNNDGTNLDLRKLKNTNNKNGSINKVEDSIKIPQNIDPGIRTQNLDGNGISPDPVVDPTKPDKPW